MPAAIAIPAIATAVVAAGQFGGAALQSRANNRAVDAQERATREAMQYQREQEWRARMDQRRQYDDWYRRYYGERPGAAATPAAAAGQTAPQGLLGATALTPPASVALGAGPGGMAPPSTPTAQPVAGAPAEPASPFADTVRSAQPRTLADLGGWSDWRRYAETGR